MITSSPFTCNTRDRVASPIHDAHHNLRRAAMSSLIATLACMAGVALAAGYTETDLVANKATLTDANGIIHKPTFVDPNLLNAWGVGESLTSPFWVADNGAGVSTLYTTAGTPQALVVSIPAPGEPLGNGGTPTGLVFNTASGSGAFGISGCNPDGTPTTAPVPAVFLFATEDGTILGWNPNVAPKIGTTCSSFTPPSTHAIIALDNSPAGAIYKGLAITNANNTPLLYTTNFHAGTVEVYGANFKTPSTSVVPAGAFSDPTLPKGYAPFNIVPIGNRMFVTYAVQDADAEDDVAGQGHGIVDTYTFHGQMLARFAQHGQLDSPWGVTLAPASFGDLAGDLLIGNFGNGHINAFNPTTGEFIDKLRNTHGQELVIDGLWTIMFGNGGRGGDVNTLYFTAGPNGESDGLFGSVAPSP